DKAYPDKNLKLFVILISAIGIIFILGNLFKGLGNYLSRYVRLRVGLSLNRTVFNKLQNLTYSFFQSSSTGENVYKINYDIEQITQLTADILPQVIILIPKSIFILAIILYVNPKMFIFALVLTPFLYIGPYHFTKILRKAWKEWVENSQGIFKQLNETLSHMHLIKSYGKGKSEARAYIENVIKNARLRLKNTRLEVTTSFLNSAIQKAILGLIVFYGGYQVIKGTMTLGSLGAISIYISQLSGVQAIFANYIQQIASGIVSCERLENILEIEQEQMENHGAGDTIFTKGRIEFKNITFGYVGEGLKPSPTDRKIFNNLSFNIEGGSCIALIGPSGCGKTTLINLLLRLYNLVEGEIFIDSHDIKNIKAKSLYDQIGVALQEPYLWNDTIENNIKYGKPDASFQEIEKAAKIACIGEFINSLPQKYNTIIGENACKISEGQKQRIAIARTVIKRPKILILDEALSSVNGELEDEIITNLRNNLNGSTLLVISHRPSTIEKMDAIIRIK
ncbi:MAG: ABC transporter ATP-binding protein, partial [Candidatus Omnitrophota bacterium]